MSRVLPAEGDLRRVIGDGETLPDGEVDGLGAEDLVALYRDLVLLRTYDERSVVYHRQGRIGTYAIFWNHEAMQVGSAYALEERDWIALDGQIHEKEVVSRRSQENPNGKQEGCRVRTKTESVQRTCP